MGRHMIRTWTNCSDTLISNVLTYHPTLQDTLLEYYTVLEKEVTDEECDHYRKMIFTDVNLNQNPQKRADIIHKYCRIRPLALFKNESVADQRMQLGLHLGTILDHKSREDLLLQWLPQFNSNLVEKIIHGMIKQP